MSRLAEEHPQIVRLEQIGKSYENRWIYKIKVCICIYHIFIDGHKIFQIGKPKTFLKPAIWIDAGIHSREWISISTALYIINEVSIWFKNPQLCKFRDV